MIEIIDGVSYFPEISSILAVSSSSIFDEKDMQVVQIGSHKIAPWGANNNLPDEILEKVKKSDIVSANLRFNRDVCYGLGPKLVKSVKKNGKIVDCLEVDDGPEYEFFENNDIPLFFLEQLTDMVHFHNAFPELIPSKKGTKVEYVRHKEAVFSRFSSMEKGRINNHYYSAKWGDSPSISDIDVSKVIDEYNALNSAKTLLALKKHRVIYPVYMPSPGRPYYSRPEWYSIFESGWYDHSIAIPELKKAIMKNNLGVKFIIYISSKYFEDIFKREGIDSSDIKASKERIDAEKIKFNDFLAGAANANKSILALKEYVMSGSSAIENKWIEIVPINNKMEGGEYISDIETAANIMCYAMNVHPNLIGATPGKSSGSLSGTDKRELFLMKQALSKPLIDRCLRVFKLIKSVNQWDKDISIVVPEYVFTTLDKNKSGKEESVNTKI